MNQRALISALRSAEDGLCILVLAIMSVLPLVEVIAREWLGSGVPGSIPIVQHMTLLISFLGAALAARSDRLLAISTGTFLPERWRTDVGIAVAFLSVAATAMFAAASIQLLAVDFQYADRAAWGIPIWMFTAMMPLTLGLVTWRLVTHASAELRGRALAALGLVAAAAFTLVPSTLAGDLVWPLGLLIVVAAALGMPIYAAIGAASLLFFWADGTPISAVPGEAYRMSTSPMLPAIPLFTLAGYILAAGGASQRLLRLLTAAVGWMPGGLAVVVTLVLALFTPLTGASGVTILAMGGLLLPLLVNGRYTQSNAVGLVTVSGSIGVFFPPSLPVILYAYYAEIDLEQLFVAGFLPGVILVTAVAAWAAWRGARGGATRVPFDARELAAAFVGAKWEVALPIVILAGLFSGYTTLVEASALTVLYALGVECLILRELEWKRDVVRVAIESTTMIGGFMIIVSVALALTNYLILAEVPTLVLEGIQTWITSPYLFLLLLNLLLIVVGAIMDIYSAIIVLVPLIAPLAHVYGIHPVHLGVIFLANMQLGYLMPPMGENLFLSAYRFEKPLSEIYRYTLPYVAIILVVVLVLTYVPAATLAPLDLFFGD